MPTFGYRDNNNRDWREGEIIDLVRIDEYPLSLPAAQNQSIIVYTPVHEMQNR